LNRDYLASPFHYHRTSNNCIDDLHILPNPCGEDHFRYEDAYVRAYPFDKLVFGMLQSEMILETVGIVKNAIEKGVLVNPLINNRAGGKRPLIAQMIAEKLTPKPSPKMKGQLSLW
jgi:hypothetical protein